MAHTSHTLPILKKLLRNKGAAFGLILIVCSLLLAVLGYFIAPDASPNANRMIPEIGSKKPGFEVQLLRLQREQNTGSPSLWHILLYGKEDSWQYVPVNSYQIQKDSLIYQRIIDDHITERKAILLKNTAAIPVISTRFYLGTDKFGRDIVSRLIIGVRVSLAVGFIAVLISLSIGIFLGAIAGYFRGKTDDIIMWLLNVIWSIPTLLLVFAITLALGKGFWQVFIAVGLTMWVNVARLVRGQVMAIRELEYVEATRVLGYSHMRTIVKHILPNILGPVLVIAAGNFASAIVIEAGLSFLGVGVQPPQPSWGLMIKENYNFIITNNPMLALAPGIAIMLLVLAFNLLGNGLRDALEVRK
ncbi:peptide/nickel transport system permease protein [Sediminibacterium goheungense]|uniref:Peptide/nickel transport system permease protein n=1 Tax=Sediminibacterium goheungense TaxID=1086393 RepID=A0A4R6IW44_9BACT|nr:peptide/nickel transport system permease protein [Sediminibacterium goheungense]